MAPIASATEVFFAKNSLKSPRDNLASVAALSIEPKPVAPSCKLPAKLIPVSYKSKNESPIAVIAPNRYPAAPVARLSNPAETMPMPPSILPRAAPILPMLEINFLDALKTLALTAVIKPDILANASSIDLIGIANIPPASCKCLPISWSLIVSASASPCFQVRRIHPALDTFALEADWVASAVALPESFAASIVSRATRSSTFPPLTKISISFTRSSEFSTSLPSSIAFTCFNVSSVAHSGPFNTPTPGISNVISAIIL